MPGFHQKILKRRFCAALLCGALLFSALPAGAGYATLRPGARGDDVLRMQQALIALGYDLKADGIYGNSTWSAVLAFQKDHGLRADGLAGNATLTALYELQGTAETGGYPAPTFIILRTATPAPARTPAQTAAGVLWARVQTSGGNLTLRQTPSTQAGVLGFIGFGQMVEVLEKGVTWSMVQYNSRIGYVQSQYLYFLDTCPATAVPAATERPTAAPRDTLQPSSAVATVTGGSLNLRSYASAAAKSLMLIPNGSVVTVLSRGASWTRVSYKGSTGYVMTRYLSFSAATVTPRPTAAPAVQPTATPRQAVQPQTDTAQVTGGRLWLRASARARAGALLSIPDGATVRVLSWGSDWCRVAYGGFTGYVMTDYLSFAVSPAQTPTVPPVRTATPAPAEDYTVQGQAVISVSSGGLNMRAYPSTSATILRSIPDGAVVSVLEKGDTWSRVLYGGGTGYVMNTYLTFIGSWATATPLPTATPAPYATPAPAPGGYDTSILTRTLRSGYTGEDVRYVQQRLNSLQYLSRVTGTYDAATIAAVKDFQRIHGLTQDGIAGPQTFTALFSSSAQPYSETVASYSTLRINYGSSVADSGAVTKMQRALSQLGYVVTVNGSFDEATHNAVVQFQMRNGLTPSGAADAATQRVLYSGSAKGATATPFLTVGANENVMQVPSASQVQLLHWYNVVKPSLSAGDTLKILDPQSGTWWNLRVYSRGRHCDSEPMTLRDTLLMNRAFGKTGWTVHVVYVQLPDGRWTMATMHNRPHLNGTITNNGFDGHLCVHFLRDMAECRQYDPDYGVTNQTALRTAWKALTGETVP